MPGARALGSILSPPCQSTPPHQKGPHPTCGLIVVDIDPLQLQVTVAMVCASGVDAMFVTDHLPKLEQVVTGRVERGGPGGRA